LVGGRKREEKRSTFDLEPPVAGHRSFPKGLAGTARSLPSGRASRGPVGAFAYSTLADVAKRLTFFLRREMSLLAKSVT
jgi:hypothetical protein